MSRSAGLSTGVDDTVVVVVVDADVGVGNESYR
jgi:hypothetical protein